MSKNQIPMKKPASCSLREILGPAITRQEAESLIQKDTEAFRIFSGFPRENREKLTEFIQGMRGLKITYDSFFKHVMNPDTHPSRLESFLSALLEQKTIIRQVLPLEGVRMSESGSFVIMDIAAELSDGTIVNVEIQKIGYLFPGERASCYISDFIMRQYNRVKDERREHFSFRDLKPVILIVIMENSSAPFKAVSPEYIHREKTLFDSGARVNSLSSVIYISLDTFHETVQNIDTELKAWLTFLSTDEPADIVRLVRAYPKFRSCYQDIVEFRKNPEELIYMYSEALAILDKNTEIYMCEELKKENAVLLKEVENLRLTVLEKDAEKNAALLQKDAEIASLRRQLNSHLK